MTTATPLRLFGDSALLEQSDPGDSCQVELETVDCLLCGSSEHVPVISAEDFLTHIGGQFRVVRCRRCQLAYTNPRPTSRSLGQFYPANYAPHIERGETLDFGAKWRTRLEIAHLRHSYGYPPQPAGALAALKSTLARVVIRRPRAREHWIPFRHPGHLLDFGCGAGEFMKQMRAYGWNVAGLDLSRRMVDALGQAGFRMFLGTLPHADIPESAYDAITMWHSLEHAPFPQDVLRAARDALRPGGILAVSVPNFAAWSFQQFQGNWFGLALPRHLTHFTPQTLCRMVEVSGLRVSSVEQVGRDGWIRKSARRADRGGKILKRLRPLRSKAFAGLAARWTELAGQADSVRLIAEKV